MGKRYVNYIINVKISYSKKRVRVSVRIEENDPPTIIEIQCQGEDGDHHIKHVKVFRERKGHSLLVDEEKFKNFLFTTNIYSEISNFFRNNPYRRDTDEFRFA